MALPVSYLSPAELFSSLLAASWASFMASCAVVIRRRSKSSPSCLSLFLKAIFSGLVILKDSGILERVNEGAFIEERLQRSGRNGCQPDKNQISPCAVY